MRSNALLLLLLAPSTVFGLLAPKITAKGKKYFGTAADPNTLSDSTIKTIITSDYNCITPENSMKWDATEPSRGSFNFGNADQTVNFATSNGRLIRGHTLVWHSQLPSWVSAIGDANTLKTVMQNHINAVAGRYKGKIYAWDVANEVFNDDGTFRNSVFYRLLGEQFIDLAFQYAHAADPNAKLYINDYNLDGPGAKIDAFLALVNRLKSRGVPINGVGTQSHLIVGQVGGVAAQLKRLAATGLDVAITELDIRIAKSVTSASLSQQQADFNTVTKACLALSNCVGITTWGISDKYSWVDSTFPSYDSPLLWDDNFNRKAAYTGVDSALN